MAIDHPLVYVFLWGHPVVLNVDIYHSSYNRKILTTQTPKDMGYFVFTIGIHVSDSLDPVTVLQGHAKQLKTRLSGVLVRNMESFVKLMSQGIEIYKYLVEHN